MATAQVILQLQQNVAPQVRAAADAYKQLSAEEQKAEQAAIRYAAAVQRANSASNAAAASEQRLAAATANATAAQNRAEISAIRLANAKDKAAGSGSSLTSTLKGLTSAAGALGVAFGVQQIVQFGISAAQSALSLRETQNGLRAVAGSAEDYQRTLAIARQQQVLFGGTLEENIAGLTGLTITARQSGADLSKLVDLSQRLGKLDPSQGTAGARIALSEALSGDPTSLAKRYEIPRAALKALRDETTSTADKLAIIDNYLNKVGITSEAVSGSVDQTAVTYRQAGAAFDDVKNAVGGFLASALEPAARGFVRLTQGSAGLTEAFTQFNAVRVAGLAYEQAYNAALQSGASETEARAAAEAAYTQAAQQAAPAVQAKTDAVLRSADADDRANSAALAHALALSKLRDEQTSAIAKVNEYIGTIQASAQASTLDAAQKGAQQAATALLNEQNRLVVDSFLQLNPTIDASAAASKAAAEGYGPQIIQLIALGVEARNAKNELDKLSGAGGVKEDRAERNTPQELAQAKTAGAQLVASQAKAAEDARRAQIAATGTTAQRLSLLKTQYAEAVKQYGKGSAEAINAQTALIQGQQSAAAAADRAGKRHTTELNRQLTLEERIADAKNKQLKATLDANAAIIRDRQDRRKEDQEIRAAQRILGSGRASSEMKAAAADRLALINIERQQRALAINEQLTTAGGQVINGRIMQSRQGGGAPVVGGVPAVGAPPALPGAIPGAPVVGPPIGEAGVLVQVFLDSEQISARVVTSLAQGRRQANSAGGGRSGV